MAHLKHDRDPKDWWSGPESISESFVGAFNFEYQQLSVNLKIEKGNINTKQLWVLVIIWRGFWGLLKVIQD